MNGRGIGVVWIDEVQRIRKFQEGPVNPTPQTDQERLEQEARERALARQDQLRTGLPDTLPMEEIFEAIGGWLGVPLDDVTQVLITSRRVEVTWMVRDHHGHHIATPTGLRRHDSFEPVPATVLTQTRVIPLAGDR